MSDQTPEANFQQAGSMSDPTVVKPVEEELQNAGVNTKPIDNVVPNQSATSMSPAPVQSGGNCMLRRGGRRSAKKRGRKSNKKARKSQKKRGGKSHKKTHK
jgi:hypothetical protein